MYKKIIFLMFTLTFILISSANAKTIIWVAQSLDGDQDGSVTDDWQIWIDKFEAEGYTVDARPAHWDALTAALVDELNAADLVIFSRATSSGDFATDAAEIALWNSVTTPMIVSSPYIVRSQRWNWLNYGDAELPNNNGDQGCPPMQAIRSSHPIFAGISLDSNKQLQFADPTVGSGHCSFAATNQVGNGTIIAKTVPTTLVQDWLWIAEWQKGVEFYNGSGTYAAGHRLYFTAGGHELPTGVNKESEYNFTEEGWKVYLNAVKYMLGELNDKASSPIQQTVRQMSRKMLS